MQFRLDAMVPAIKAFSESVRLASRSLDRLTSGYVKVDELLASGVSDCFCVGSSLRDCSS